MAGHDIIVIGTSEPLRFRYHTGHAFTADVFLSEQIHAIENALWSAVQAMKEKVTFSRHMAERMASDTNLTSIRSRLRSLCLRLPLYQGGLRGIGAKYVLPSLFKSV
ncbi:MAG: hypothetical protein NW224_16365 [Leptolyngbyaceae cyanobacterium bins.302]|nr:hypothetical protein [Leptolyngbyaceae cyanobacterium bins.302]